MKKFWLIRELRERKGPAWAESLEKSALKRASLMKKGLWPPRLKTGAKRNLLKQAETRTAGDFPKNADALKSYRPGRQWRHA